MNVLRCSAHHQVVASHDSLNDCEWMWANDEGISAVLFALCLLTWASSLVNFFHCSLFLSSSEHFFGRWPHFFIEFTHFSTHQTFNSIRLPIACLLLPSTADNVRLHGTTMSCQLSLSRIEPTDTLNYVQTTEHRLSSLATANRCSASQFLYSSWFIGFMSVCWDTKRGGCRLQLDSLLPPNEPRNINFDVVSLPTPSLTRSLTRCEFLDGLPWENFISKPEMNWGNSKPCYENICRVFYGVCEPQQPFNVIIKFLLEKVKMVKKKHNHIK